MLHLLFSFNGRINRAQYWLSCLILGILGFVGIASFMMMSIGSAVVGAKDPAAGLQGLLAGAAFIVPFCAFLAWAGFAVQVKRFHDRGRSGFLTLIPLGLTLIATTILIGAAISNATPQAVAESLQPFVLAGWAVNLWFFIDLGCLPGVEGPNKYGNPPGSPPSPTQHHTGPAPASTLGGAEAAMQRALAESKRAPQFTPTQAIKPQPAPQATKPAAAPGFGQAAPAPSFGRRAAR
jgi:uncharacterized membrane protein YhaH (DUF805 family)